MDLNKKRVMLLPGAFQSPSARFRILQFERPLRDIGYDVAIRIPYPDRENKNKRGEISIFNKISPKLSAIIRYITAMFIIRDAYSFDYIISNRDIVPEVSIRNLEKYITKNNKVRYVLDVDDAIYLGSRGEKLKEFLPRVYCVVAGNIYLAEYLSQFHDKVLVIPTVADTMLYIPRKDTNCNKIIIGWMGSSGTNKYLSLLKAPLERLSKDYEFEFLVVSDKKPDINWVNVAFRFVFWNDATEVSLLQEMTIGLMPLFNGDFEKGKCGAKAILYMSVGIPALVSPVGINKEIVTHGKDGFHCYTEDDWYSYLVDLIQSPNLRREMGGHARIKVEAKYSVNAAMDIWKSILK